MSSIIIQVPSDTAPCSCQDCGWQGPASALEMVSSIEERICAGETVPAGQCPACGALAHLDEPETPEPVYVLGVEGGIVQGMSSNVRGTPPRIIVIDWDCNEPGGVLWDEKTDRRVALYEHAAVHDPEFVDKVVAAIEKAEADQVEPGDAQ